jgi:cytochrome c1
VADNTKDLPVEERSFRRSYLIFAGLLAATTLWAAVDETWVRRPWKDYQANFNKLEANEVRELIAAGEQALVAEDAALPANQTMAGLAAAAEELRKVVDTPEFQEMERNLQNIEDHLFNVEREFQFAKALSDEVYYEWKEQEYEGHDFSQGKAEWDELGREMKELQPVIDSITTQRDKLKDQIEAARGDLKAVEDQIAARRNTIIELERRLTNIEGRTVEVKQIVLSDFEPNEWGQPIMRVDRCETCHMGIDRSGFEDWPQPYTTHPKRTDIFGNHPVEKFACTPCHDGQGPGLTVEEAHNGQHLWPHPMLAGDNIDAGCQKCHFNRIELGTFVSEEQIDDMELEPQDVPYHPTKLIRGQKMIRDNQCYACHEIAGYENLPKKAPQLNAMAAKTTPEWTYDWLKGPTRFRPTTKMPDPLLPDSEALAVTAFLFRVASQSDFDFVYDRVPAGNAERGGTYMAEFGCYGCHSTEGMYEDGDPALDLIVEGRDADRWIHGPDLTRIGSKASKVWVYNWIKDPKHYWSESRMPSLRLTDREAADITTFLMGLTDDVAQREAMPAGANLDNDALVDMGEYWVRTYGCYGCHDIKGFENTGKVSVSLSEFGTKQPEELAFGDAVTEMDQTWLDWTTGKLTYSRRYATEAVVQRMPNFNFTEAEADTMALVLRSWDGRRVYEDYTDPTNKWMEMRHAGRLVSEFYNCQGCHIVEGQGGGIRSVIGNVGLSPPNLNTEGNKVQSDWLYRFLSEPFAIRPWLKVRMPSFGFDELHKTAVVDYFHALEENEEHYDFVDVSTFSKESLRTGEKHFTTLKCLSCHVLENRAFKPEELANLAPNLSMAYDRLRPEWVVDWLRDPQVIDPGTRMPSFFYSEGVRLYDDADAQMEALRDYLMTIGAPKP